MSDGIGLVTMAHPDTERRKRLFEMISLRLAEGVTPATSGLVDDIIAYMDADVSEDALETVEIELPGDRPSPPLRPRKVKSIPADPVFAKAADQAMAELKAQIEALADRVGYSVGALNEDRGEHFVIANGCLKKEREPRAPWPGLEAACRSSLDIAQMMSAHHRGDQVTLFWRVEPEWEMFGADFVTGRPAQPGTYMRLSFSVNGVPR